MIGSSCKYVCMGYLNASFTVLTLYISQWSRNSSYNSQQQSSVACTWRLTMENKTQNKQISVVLMWHNHNYLCLTHFLFYYYHDHYLLLVFWWPCHMTICYYSISTAAVILPRRSRLILATFSAFRLSQRIFHYYIIPGSRSCLCQYIPTDILSK